MSTAEQIAVMQAHDIDKKPVEYQGIRVEPRDTWATLPTDFSAWNWADYRYRVAEERPREVWLKMDGKRIDSAMVLGTQADADTMGYTHFVELPDGWEVRRKEEPEWRYCRVLPADRSTLWRCPVGAEGPVSFKNDSGIWEDSPSDTWTGLSRWCTETDAAGRPVEGGGQ